MAVWLDAKPNQSRLIDSDWVETSAEDAPVPLKQLLGGLSYSASYLQAATNAAAGVGVATSAFAFTCKATEIAEKPDIGRQPDGSIFLGLFPYHPKARAYGATACTSTTSAPTTTSHATCSSNTNDDFFRHNSH